MIVTGKELIERIKDKEYSEDLIKELEKYEVKKTKSVWELEFNDEIWVTYYHYAKSEYIVLNNHWQWYGSQNYRRKLGKVHLTKERAEHHARVLDTELAVKKWKREHDNVVLYWGGGSESKYHFEYDTENGEINVNLCRIFKLANTIYFSSVDKAKQCINDIGEERIIEWLKWEDSDQ